LRHSAHRIANNSRFEKTTLMFAIVLLATIVGLGAAVQQARPNNAPFVLKSMEITPVRVGTINAAGGNHISYVLCFINYIYQYYYLYCLQFVIM
jgi:hypothetical protein